MLKESCCVVEGDMMLCFQRGIVIYREATGYALVIGLIL